MWANLECILSHLQVIHQALPVFGGICHLGLDTLHPVFGHHKDQQFPTGSHCTQPGLAMLPVTQELLWGYTDKGCICYSTQKQRQGVQKQSKSQNPLVHNLI